MATSIKARIQAFETQTFDAESLSSPPRNIPRSPAAAYANSNRSPSPSPPNLGRKSSLIDLKDWVLDDGPTTATLLPIRTPKPRPSQLAGLNGTTKSAPLIQLESPPKLPPRKASYNSLKSVSSVASSTVPQNIGKLKPPPLRSDSLTIDHTYPPESQRKSPNGHVPAASSISSFHSVSLSSDGTPGTPSSISSHFISSFPMDDIGSEADAVSLNDSYEDVGAGSIASPSTAAAMAYGWDRHIAARQAPKLPQRPPSVLQRSQSSSSSASSATSQSTRRAPPPVPPPRHNSNRSSLASTSASDRSSIRSVTTTTSRSSTSTNSRPLPAKLLLRPTPVPPTARARYEAVFDANVIQRRKVEAEREKQQSSPKPSLLSPFAAKKSRQAAGWRGLSVDLITNPEDNPVNAPTAVDEDQVVVGPDERLEGHIVKCIWSRSKLTNQKLSDIWLECDLNNRGSLDRAGFAKGMWRIDEELRRAQMRSATSSSPVFRLRQAPPPKPRQMLR